MVEVVGLGRREEDPVDPPGDETGQPARPADPEEARIATSAGPRDRRSAAGPAFKRLQRVDENDLAVEPREMIAEERAHDRVLIGGVAAGHHRAKRTRRRALRRRQRREGQRRRAVEIARH